MTNFDTIISSSTPTLVDFYAKWCGPCKMQAPILEQVKQQIGDKATILKIDVDHDNELASIYHVQSIPTLILFKDGKILWRVSGVRQANTILSKINEALYKLPLTTLRERHDYLSHIALCIYTTCKCYININISTCAATTLRNIVSG